MQFHLYKLSGYEETIMALRMSKGKYFSWEIAQQIQDLVYVVTDKRGFIATPKEHALKCELLGIQVNENGESNHKKVSGNYEKDVAEFKRLLALTMNNAMGEFDHHTLMKYLDISFFTVGLHRGAQDDLDAHAIGFNNRITRYSTRLAVINEVKLSEWYQDKIIPFDHALQALRNGELLHDTGEVVDPSRYGLPDSIKVGEDTFKYTPFGYVLDKFADMSENSGLRKDVLRGGMPLGLESNALWKTDLFNLRYIYFRRSKLTKANPELKDGMEQLFDQLEENLPVFGEHVRHELTDSGVWEHMNKIRTITRDEFEQFKRLKAQGLIS